MNQYWSAKQPVLVRRATSTARESDQYYFERWPILVQFRSSIGSHSSAIREYKI